MPSDKTVSGLRLGLVLAGIGIALPSMVSGAQIGAELGLSDSIMAFLVAGLFVSALGTISGLVGSKTRLSTYMLIRFSFGRKGSHLVNVAFALSQLGWFGVNAYLFGDAAGAVGGEIGLDLSPALYIIFGGVLMTASTIFGFKALDKLALFAVPLLMVVLVVMIANTFGIRTWEEISLVEAGGALSFPDAVSALSGGIMVGVVLLPDLTRYSRSTLHTVIAILISLALVEPLIHTAAAIPGLAVGQSEVLPILLAVGFGGFALLFIIFTSWTTNAVNLYGSGLALTAVNPNFREWRVIAASGVIGTIVALFDVPGFFLDFLYAQALIFTPVVGVYATDFYLIRGQSYDLAGLSGESAINRSAYLAWFAGMGIAFLGAGDIFTITTIPAFDAALVSALFYYLLRRTEKRVPVAAESGG